MYYQLVKIRAAASVMLALRITTGRNGERDEECWIPNFVRREDPSQRGICFWITALRKSKLQQQV
jgi:hypothetical protein